MRKEMNALYQGAHLSNEEELLTSWRARDAELRGYSTSSH